MSVIAVLLTLIYSCSSWKLPSKMIGFYCLIADDTVSNYSSTAQWQPKLYPFQINGTNVIFFTFVNPQKMPAVPPAMANLAKCKGSAGCPPESTPVIFSIGGEAYSNAQWPWLQSSSAAEAMAAEVAQWDTKYGANGIDLDIEGSAGSSDADASNLIVFAKKVRELNPKLIITQPVYGYPQIKAEDNMVNTAFAGNKNQGIVDSIGIMEYNGVESLQYVKDYGNATSEWDGFPITVDVPYENIVAGINGNAGSSGIMQMASDINKEGLGGMMVWLSSVYDETKGGMAFTYGGGAMDASKSTSSQSTWAQALASMHPIINTTTSTTTTSTTTTSTTTTTIGPISGCLFKSADSKHQLNLTQYEGVTLAKVNNNDDPNNELIYGITPCDNGLICNNKKVNSYILNAKGMKCNSYLSMYTGVVIPKYDETEKIWQFIYENGEQCNGLSPLLEVFWICDVYMINKAEVVYAGSPVPCSYQIHINSSSACY